MTGEAGKKTLRQSISISVVWMVGLRIAEKGLGLISSIVLARLLFPEDFGLIALATSLYALIRLTREFGFGVALIQNQAATRLEYDTAWTIQVLFSVVAAILLVLTMGFAVDFYDEPRLAGILLAYALVFVISGFNNIGAIDFQKDMAFDKVFWLRVMPKLLSSISSICLAFYLRSYWALMISQILFSLCSLYLSFSMHPYRPTFTLKAWRSLMGFSSWLMVNNMIRYVDRHGRHMVIAKIGGPQMLGILTIATDFATIVSRDLIGSVNTATYPAYAKVAHNKERLAGLFLDMNSAIAVAGIPASVGLAALSPLFVPVLLGDRWLEAINVVPAIAFASVFLSFTAAYDIVLLALARQKFTTLLLFIRLLIFFPLMYEWAMEDGAAGVARAMLIANALTFPLYLIALQNLIGVTIGQALTATLRPVLASGAMYIAMMYFIDSVGEQSLNLAGLGYLVITVLLGVVVYIAAILVACRIAGAKNGIEMKLLRMLDAKIRGLL
jgi:O-antigen/teichoic acid export membrane protein